jgi:hypothetical protein
VARWLFTRRIKQLGLACAWIEADYLIEPLLSGAPGLDSWLAHEHDVAVLFSNVLGQMRFLVDEARWPQWVNAFRTRLLPALASVPWASYHDRLSGELEPAVPSGVCSPGLLSNEELVARFYEDALNAPMSVAAELSEHETDQLFPEQAERHYFKWQLEPGYWFLIEALRTR